ESHKGRLETFGKMLACNPGLTTDPFSDFGTGRSQNGDYRRLFMDVGGSVWEVRSSFDISSSANNSRCGNTKPRG
ncbi:hypothetical protein HAX54_008585, partial [Datura stramonium]|nr:hypothetical protein [Datura stramonium]